MTMEFTIYEADSAYQKADKLCTIEAETPTDAVMAYLEDGGFPVDNTRSLVRTKMPVDDDEWEMPVKWKGGRFRVPVKNNLGQEESI